MECHRWIGGVVALHLGDTVMREGPMPRAKRTARHTVRNRQATGEECVGRESRRHPLPGAGTIGVPAGRDRCRGGGRRIRLYATTARRGQDHPGAVGPLLAGHRGGPLRAVMGLTVG